MSLLYLLLIAAIQGLTEFIPVSSSAHLILLPALIGGPDQGLAIDVAVHVGTLLSVLIYFRSQVGLASLGTLRLLRGRVDTPGAHLALCLVIGTIPVVIAGLLLKLTGLDEALRSIAVVGWAMLIFGLVLYWADQTGATNQKSEDWTTKDALYMGLSQVIALIPGASRSGITITAARRLGYDREDAATLSMLMSIPTIIASGVLLGADVIKDADWEVARAGLMAASFSFIASLIALSLMMRLLRSVSFTPYVGYRIFLGLLLLWIAYGGGGFGVEAPV
jgi:undecaprenyl-diphosphatase